MGSNPHQLIPELLAEEVGELEIRHENRQVLRCPPDWGLDRISERLRETGNPPGEYHVFALHYSTRKQMKGYATFTLPKGPPEAGGETVVLSAVLEQHFTLQQAQMAELRALRASLEERERELDRRESEQSSRHHQTEIELIQQRHQAGMSHNERLWDLEREREQAYGERQSKLDADREAVALERQKMSNESFTMRLQALNEAHEFQLAAMTKAHQRRLDEIEARMKRATEIADPLALLKLLPDKALSRWVEAQLPSSAEPTGSLEALVAQLEPVARLIQGLAPRRVLAASPAPASIPPPSAPISAPSSKSKTFRG